MEIVPSGQLIDKITTYDEYLASDEMQESVRALQKQLLMMKINK